MACSQNVMFSVQNSYTTMSDTCIVIPALGITIFVAPVLGEAGEENQCLQSTYCELWYMVHLCCSTATSMAEKWMYSDLVSPSR